MVSLRSSCRALVVQDFDIGQTGRVIDGDMHEIPACPPVARPARACGAVSRSIKVAQLLDIKVDQRAWTLALIAAHGQGRVDLRQQPQPFTTQPFTTQPFTAQPARHSGARQPKLGGNRRACQSQTAAQMHNLGNRFGG